MNTRILKTLGYLKFGIVPALLVFAFGTVALAGAHSDYDKSFNLAGLKTWDFANSKVNASDTTGKNDVWDGELRQSITSNLQNAGLTQTSDNPDFMVRYHLGTKENLRTEVYQDRLPGFVGYRRGFANWRGGWGGNSWGSGFGGYGGGFGGGLGGFGYGGGGFGNTTVYSIPYDESTLVVDIVDAQNKQLVWRGYDTKTIDASRSDKTLEKAAASVVERFQKDARKAAKQKK